MEELKHLTEDGAPNGAPDVFQNDDSIYNNPIKPIPKPEKPIGVDISGEFYDNIVDAGQSGILATSNIERFTQVSDSRNQLYNMMDSMMSDPTIAKGVEIYAENCTEANSEGRVVWAESEDKVVAEYVNHFLDVINVDKHAYEWILSLIKYGDLYLRLYRNSEYNGSIFQKQDKETLNEKVNIKAYSQNDKYSNYVEMVKDPSVMFELTRFGKTEGYIEAQNPTQMYMSSQLTNQYAQFQFNTGDINIYEAKEFVHAYLADTSSRYTETVNISSGDDGKEYTYSVRKGRPMLYDLYKIWRQQSLLENSVILNRVTRSAITRILSIDVGDMSKDQVTKRVAKIKSMIEQKSAIKSGEGMSDYTDPSPVENIIYLPVNGEKGGIQQLTIGGDVNVGELTDLDYFKDKYYGAFGIPKQYMGDTGDSAGFDAGASLAQISSKFAKKVKRIQLQFVQMIESLVNLVLIDRDLDGYINKFTLKMVYPATKEETDRQNNAVARVSFATDVVNAVSNVIDDEETKLKVLRTMMTNAVGETEVPAIIDDYIKRREAEITQEDAEEESEGEDTSDVANEQEDRSTPLTSSPLGRRIGEPPFGVEKETEEEETVIEPTEREDREETVLPTPASLNMDFTDNSAE